MTYSTDATTRMSFALRNMHSALKQGGEPNNTALRILPVAAAMVSRLEYLQNPEGFRSEYPSRTQIRFCDADSVTGHATVWPEHEDAGHYDICLYNIDFERVGGAVRGAITCAPENLRESLLAVKALMGGDSEPDEIPSR